MESLNVLGGGAVQGLVQRLRPVLEARLGRPVVADFGAVGAMAERYRQGEPCDVLVLSEALIERLAQEGHLVAHSAVPVGSVKTGVALRLADAVPPLALPDELRNALLAATSIHVPDPVKSTAGIHVMDVLRRLGIADAVQARMRSHANGATAMAALSRAEDARPIGCTQITEILLTPGVKVASALEGAFALATVYVGAVTRRSSQPQVAALFVQEIGSPRHADVRRLVGIG